MTHLYSFLNPDLDDQAYIDAVSKAVVSVEPADAEVLVHFVSTALNEDAAVEVIMRWTRSSDEVKIDPTSIGYEVICRGTPTFNMSDHMYKKYTHLLHD